MAQGNAPTVNGRVTPERITQRSERLKLALVKDGIKPERKARIEAELEALSQQANKIKASLEGV